MVSNYAVSEEPITESAGALHKLYVKVDTANIRQCPLPTCTVVGTFNLNSLVTTSANSLAEAPEWIEVTYDADSGPSEQTLTGYINKVTLSDEPVSASKDGGSPPPGGRGSSSVGGVTIGPWGNIETTVGESYEFHFCEPSSAISGATCGGLVDKAIDPRGGTPPYSFVKKSGFLPPGMTLELNGIFRGVPTVVGTYAFTLCAKDLHGGEGCQDLAVVVKKDQTTLTPSSPPEKIAPVASPPAEEIPDYGHTVDSTTCTLSPSNNPYDTFFNKRVQASGTAWGPIGASVSLSAAGYEHECGAWTNVRPDSDSGYCKRGPGDPERTNWALDESSSSQYKTFSVFVTSGCCELPTSSYPAKEYPFEHTKILDQPCN